MFLYKIYPFTLYPIVNIFPILVQSKIFIKIIVLELFGQIEKYFVPCCKKKKVLQSAVLISVAMVVYSLKVSQGFRL